MSGYRWGFGSIRAVGVGMAVRLLVKWTLTLLCMVPQRGVTFNPYSVLILGEIGIALTEN